MQPKDKDQKQEEAKGSNRLAHLREIEISRQKLWKENHVFEADRSRCRRRLAIKIRFRNQKQKKIFNNISLSLHEWSFAFRPRLFIIKSRISIALSKTSRKKRPFSFRISLHWNAYSRCS